MTNDEILKRCEEWFAAYMHDRESYDEATPLLAALRNRGQSEPKGKAPPDHEWDENGKCKWCPAENRKASHE